MQIFTKEQKELLAKNGLNWRNWRIVEETENELVLVARRGYRRTIKK